VRNFPRRSTDTALRTCGSMNARHTWDYNSVALSDPRLRPEATGPHPNDFSSTPCISAGFSSTGSRPAWPSVQRVVRRKVSLLGIPSTQADRWWAAVRVDRQRRQELPLPTPRYLVDPRGRDLPPARTNCVLSCEVHAGLCNACLTAQAEALVAFAPSAEHAVMPSRCRRRCQKACDLGNDQFQL